MATPPSDSRQPPDGDEFPDFVDNNNEIVNYSTPIIYRSLEQEKELNTMESFSKNKESQTGNVRKYASQFEAVIKTNTGSEQEPVLAHGRSLGLINPSSSHSNQKPDVKTSKWNDIAEQRRKRLSKLKGLVIPETEDNDASTIGSTVNIPEIKNLDAAAIFSLPKHSNLNSPQISPPAVPKMLTPVSSWTSNTSQNLPKYSPAFKRKSLHVYTSNVKLDQPQEVQNNDANKYCDKLSPRPNKLMEDDLNPPKSLESISSPTRSDCSFDYATVMKKSNESLPFKPQTNKLEDESDNDSAVSSSQSSFNSRFSPPPSPTKAFQQTHFKRADEHEKLQSRFLNASSTEAINRRNILASAKCSSGNNFLNLDTALESPPLPKKNDDSVLTETTPPLPEKQHNVKELSEVKNSSSTWESGAKSLNIKLVDRPPRREFTRSTESLPELGTPLKPVPRSSLHNTFSKETPSSSLKSLVRDSASSLSLTSSLYSSRKAKPLSVKALTENFEKFGATPPPLPQKSISKQLIPSKSVRQEILKAENKINVSAEAVSKPEIQTKSRPSKIIPKEMTKSEENLLADKFAPKMHTEIIILKVKNAEMPLGISINGGVDENSDIVVHRIRYASIAYQDGRLKKGDKIVAINGKPTKGLTYADAVELLKEPVAQFVIEKLETDTLPPPPGHLQRRSSSLLSIDSKLSTTSAASTEVLAPKIPTAAISFSKDGSGLGFSIEGGKDSLQGDVPLVIKKIFTGGAADKNGELKPGDEIIYVNDINFTTLTRIEAWNSMKKIPDGMVKIQIFRKV